jgi:hypothetical protein
VANVKKNRKMRKVFLALLLVFAVASAIDVNDRRPEYREVLHEAIRFISEQVHLEPEKRTEILKKLLRSDIDVNEAAEIIKSIPSRYEGIDNKFEMRVQEISERLKGANGDVPLNLRRGRDYEKIREKYKSEKLRGEM